MIDIQEAVTSAADALLAAEWRPPQTEDEVTWEWGVDRGAVFSKHREEDDARSEFEHCKSNGLRVRLNRRVVGPWEQVEQS